MLATKESERHRLTQRNLCLAGAQRSVSSRRSVAEFGIPALSRYHHHQQRPVTRERQRKSSAPVEPRLQEDMRIRLQYLSSNSVLGTLINDGSCILRLVHACVGCLQPCSLWDAPRLQVEDDRGVSGFCALTGARVRVISGNVWHVWWYVESLMIIKSWATTPSLIRSQSQLYHNSQGVHTGKQSA